jgi:hypothetical protein
MRSNWISLTVLFSELQRAEVHNKRGVAEQIKQFHLDPEGVMPCSQEFASRICSEPFESGPQHRGVIMNFRFNTVYFSTRQPYKWFFFHQVFQPNCDQ